LVLISEWESPVYLQNLKGKFDEKPKELAPKGWWRSAALCDIDLDGDKDILLGNEGLNTFYKASETEPIQIMAKDFDENGSIDPILGYYIKGKLVPSAPLGTLSNQIPFVRNIYQNYTDYSKATFENLLPENLTKNALKLQAVELKSGYLENDGSNNFSFKAFPLVLQTSPIRAFHIDNFDIYIEQNTTEDEANLGTQDAGGYYYLKATKKGLIAIAGKPTMPINEGFYATQFFEKRVIIRRK
jgi:enediyne biosynthesis protein E4